MKDLIRFACVVAALAAAGAAADSFRPRTRSLRHIESCPRCGIEPTGDGEFSPPLFDCPEMRRISWETATVKKGYKHAH